MLESPRMHTRQKPFWHRIHNVYLPINSTKQRRGEGKPRKLLKEKKGGGRGEAGAADPGAESATDSRL